MSGETDLSVLVQLMRPRQVVGEYVFVVTSTLPDDVESFAMVREPEGTTYVVRKGDADRYSMEYEFVAGWIVLEVHSALSAVGLTAVVSQSLADADISCNVLAGYFHDHLLVPHAATKEALTVLARLVEAGPTSTKTL